MQNDVNYTVEVFDIGSELAVPQAGMVGVVEKVLLGAGGTVQYQLICYSHGERIQGMYNDFEVAPLEDKTSKQTLGFAQAPVSNESKEVHIILNEDNVLLDVSSPEDVLIRTNMIKQDEFDNMIMEPEGNDETKTEEI